MVAVAELHCIGSPSRQCRDVSPLLISWSVVHRLRCATLFTIGSPVVQIVRPVASICHENGTGRESETCHADSHRDNTQNLG